MAVNVYKNMVHRVAQLSIAVVMVVILAGCGRSDASMSRVEALMQSNPQEALTIMEGIDGDHLWGEHRRARYALLYSEALYYNYVDVESDSLSSPMAQFYMDSRLDDERARALYQHALICRNQGELAEAMVVLEEAEESLFRVENIKLRGLVARAKGDIYADGCLFANALEAYGLASEIFESLGLDYHSASAKYDMGGMLIQLREFESAEATLSEALEYGVSVMNREFICAVLHELLDLSIYRDDYAACRSYIDRFATYDALIYGMAHYHAVLAMLISRDGEMSEALSLLDRATQMDDVEWADIEYARYIVYRNGGDTQNALYWQERSKHAQDRLMLEVLEQPVLNVQIDMLRQNLDAEHRERELIRQRNIVIYIIIVLVLVMLGLYIWRRLRRKDEELARYVEMVDEMQSTLRTMPAEMAATVGALYRDRFSEFNELCDIYYDHSGTTRHKSLVFNKLSEAIEAIKSDVHRLEELEAAVDKYRDGLMRRLRSEMPKLNERDMRVALYVFAGFSNRAIAIFIDSDPVSVSKLRYNIKHKIRLANTESCELFVAALSDK